MTTTDTEVTVTPEDIAAWERYGPAIFHCEMTGPEALARHRTLTPAQAAGPVLLEALKDILPGKLCGESWNLPDDDTVSIVVTFGKLSRARAAIAQAEGPQA